MSADRRDEIDEVLSKYLPSKGSPGGELISENPGQGEDVAGSEDCAAEHVQEDARDGSGGLTDGMFAWVKANLIFIFPAIFLTLSLFTTIVD